MVNWIVICGALLAALALSGCSTDREHGSDAPADPTTPSASASEPAPRPNSRNDARLDRLKAVAFGMSAPDALWSARLAEVGEIDARRVYGQLGSPERALRIARGEQAVGRMPVVSFKVPGDDWAAVAAGHYDDLLLYVVRELAAPGGRVFVTLHHEPASDGSPVDYAAMMRHALPILGAPTNVDAGPVLNGFWWSNERQGLTDQEISRWLPPDVLAVSELVAVDSYDTWFNDRVIEDAARKTVNFSAWARDVGVERLGVAEYSGATPESLEKSGRVVLSNPRMEFALVFNSDVNTQPGRGLVLSGARLEAFRQTLATARRLRGD